MQETKRGLVFWVLLLLVVALPSSLLATKRMYQASLATDSGAGLGSAVITMRPPGSWDYMAGTHTGGQNVAAVTLSGPRSTGTTWTMWLCVNGGAVEDDCTYIDDGGPRDGQLSIEGAITPTLLMGAGVSGRDFQASMEGGTTEIHLLAGDGSSVGGGTFTRTF